MSAPRPFETDPFHPHSSVRILLLGLLEYICKNVSIISSMWYVQSCLSVLYIDICACNKQEINKSTNSHSVSYAWCLSSSNSPGIETECE